MLRQVADLAATGGRPGAFGHFTAWLEKNGPFDVIIVSLSAGCPPTCTHILHLWI